MTKTNHQGVVAFTSAIEYQSLENIVPMLYEQGKDPFLVLLDGVTDVRNFGAIARTCECAGVDAIVVPTKGAAAGNAVKKDSPVALNNLGEMLEIGEGIPADKQEAVSLYRRSVDQNNGGGWRNLGRLYESGLCGFVKNLKEAEKCYKKAIEDGSTTVWSADEKKLVPVAKVAQEDLNRVCVKMQQEQ